jgi:putative phosphoesterase
VITVVSDTHSTSGHELSGRTRDAVREADLVVHAGDFTTSDALDAFQSVSKRLFAVHGNNATSEVRDRLPDARTFEESGIRFALTHRRDGGSTGLELFGRERDADVVVFGHSHRHLVRKAGEVTLLNPGSHARPRGNLPTHVELEPDDNGVTGQVRTHDGSLVEEFHIGR